MTEGEYRRQEAFAARGFSGHWMLFYWLSVVGIYDGLRRGEARREERRQLARTAPPLTRPRRYTMQPAPRLTPWQQFVPNREDNVYFSLVGEEDEAAGVLGIWTSHVCLSFGRPVPRSDVDGVFHRA